VEEEQADTHLVLQEQGAQVVEVLGVQMGQPEWLALLTLEVAEVDLGVLSAVQDHKLVVLVGPGLS
jgi:hypothetical protein